MLLINFIIIVIYHLKFYINNKRGFILLHLFSYIVKNFLYSCILYILQICVTTKEIQSEFSKNWRIMKFFENFFILSFIVKNSARNIHLLWNKIFDQNLSLTVVIYRCVLHFFNWRKNYLRVYFLWNIEYHKEKERKRNKDKI